MSSYQKVCFMQNAAYDEPAENKERRFRLTEIWEQATPLTGSDVGSEYFDLCGLDIPDSKDIRFHSGLSHIRNINGDNVDYGKHPAIVSVVRNMHELPATLHCTYLSDNFDNGALAGLEQPHLVLPSVENFIGGYVRLGRSQRLNGPLALVAGGIEISMKIASEKNMQTLSLLSDSNLLRFVPNEFKRRDIHIIAFKDETFHAEYCAHKLASIICLSGGKVSSVEMKDRSIWVEEHNWYQPAYGIDYCDLLKAS